MQTLKITLITLFFFITIQAKSQFVHDNIPNIIEDNADRYFVKEAFRMASKERRPKAESNQAVLYFLYATSPICYYDTLTLETPKEIQSIEEDEYYHKTLINWQYANKTYSMISSKEFKQIGSNLLFKGYELKIVEENENCILTKTISFFALVDDRYKKYSDRVYDEVVFREIKMDDRKELCEHRRSFLGYNTTHINYKDKNVSAKDFNIEIREMANYNLTRQRETRITGDSIGADKYLILHKIGYASVVEGYKGSNTLFDGKGYFNQKYEDVEEAIITRRDPIAK